MRPRQQTRRTGGDGQQTSQASRPAYVAVEGPIGVGKTTLVSKLAERFSAKVVLEIVEENPFLSDFYQDRDTYAFQTQLFFLLSRFRQQEALCQPDLFHRYILSDYIFAKDRLFASLTLSDAEMLLYDQVFGILDTRVLKPDLVVYLQARLDVLLDRIQRRGRPFEKDFDADYLKRLSQNYNEYFFHYNETPLLVVDTSDIDVVASEADLQDLVGSILNHRGGMQFYKPLGR